MELSKSVAELVGKQFSSTFTAIDLRMDELESSNTAYENKTKNLEEHARISNDEKKLLQKQVLLLESRISLQDEEISQLKIQISTLTNSYADVCCGLQEFKNIVNQRFTHHIPSSQI